MFGLSTAGEQVQLADSGLPSQEAFWSHRYGLATEGRLVWPQTAELAADIQAESQDRAEALATCREIMPVVGSKVQCGATDGAGHPAA